MILDFQCLYRLPAWAGAEEITVKAETAEEAERRLRACFPHNSELLVNVGTGNNPQLDLVRLMNIGANPQEQAYLLDVDANLLSDYKSKGYLPRPETGRVSQLPPKVLADFNLKRRFGLKNWEAAA